MKLLKLLALCIWCSFVSGMEIQQKQQLSSLSIIKKINKMKSSGDGNYLKKKWNGISKILDQYSEQIAQHPKSAEKISKILEDRSKKIIKKHSNLISSKISIIKEMENKIKKPYYYVSKLCISMICCITTLGCLSPIEDKLTLIKYLGLLSGASVFFGHFSSKIQGRKLGEKKRIDNENILFVSVALDLKAKKIKPISASNQKNYDQHIQLNEDILKELRENN